MPTGIPKNGARRSKSDKENLKKASSKLQEYIRKGKQLAKQEEELDVTESETSESEDEIIVERRVRKPKKEVIVEEEPEEKPVKPEIKYLTKEDLMEVNRTYLDELKELKAELAQLKTSNTEMSKQYQRAVNKQIQDVNAQLKAHQSKLMHNLGW